MNHYCKVSKIFLLLIKKEQTTSQFTLNSQIINTLPTKSSLKSSTLKKMPQLELMELKFNGKLETLLLNK
jgi:hypothetical protein